MKGGRGWIFFGVGAAGLVAALIWVSSALIDLRVRESDASRRAQRYEAMRLALWRLDGAMQPVLAQENTRALAADWPAENRLGPPMPFFRTYFTQSGKGHLALPAGDDSRKLDELRALQLPECFSAEIPGWTIPGLNTEMGNNLFAQNAIPWAQDENRTFNDYNTRRRNQNRVQQQALSNVQPMATPAKSLRPLHPVWVSTSRGGQLFLLRLTVAGVTQGIWVDWPELARWLFEEIADLLPDARMTPILGRSVEPNDRQLAALPAVLDPGPLPGAAGVGRSTTVMLVVMWAAVVATLTAGALLLRASSSLSERRGRFVSAVTHELRTPLTTFRMYAQMLADGMVPREETRREYLETLRTESDRLARVVESVLLFSRLEEGGPRARRERREAEELLESVLPALAARARDGAMELVFDLDVPRGTTVDVDPQAIEQILLNLVDNACKYAHDAEDKRIVVSASLRQGKLEIGCRDYGSGVDRAESRAIFRPFQRAARHEAGPISGAGLGLALARGLAGASGGSLEVDSSVEVGAAFRLTIPVAA